MPTWKDITIEKYERIAELQTEALSEIDLVASTIAILDGTKLSEVEEMPYSVLLLKARGLRFLQSNPLPSLVKKTYELGGVKYIATLKPEQLTTAQYIDFQVRATDAPEDLAGILSVILIPEGHKYNEGYSSDETREAIYKNMAIEDAMGLSAFFFVLWKKSTNKLLRLSKKALRKLKRKRNKSPEEIELIKSLNNLIEIIEAVRKYY